MRSNIFVELNKLEIDELTEKLILLHQSLTDEKRFPIDSFPKKFSDNKLFKTTAEKLIKELKHHIYKEEHILFPYLINLSKFFRKEIPFERPYFHSVRNAVEIMKSDHEMINVCINKLKVYITDQEDKSKSNNSFFEKMKIFLEDVERVIYLENEILFNRAIELEKSLLKE